MNLALISDTHMPKGARRLPDDCVARLEAADLIIHAGDLTELEVLREIESYGPTVAVHGNVDSAEVRAELPEALELDANGATIAVIHDAGPARGRVERLRARFSDADAVVFGHSHIPLHERTPDGFQIFNPGSPTERRRSPKHTIGVATMEGGKLTFSLVVLG
ncbi:MAG TPA: metallophosphoesterase family protein [Solirubrobacteraceae bacterium]